MAKQATMDAIENTIDTVGDTYDTLERIPKVNLNGTTKNQQILILGTVAGMSAFAGIALYHGVRKAAIRLRHKRKNVVSPVREVNVN